MATRHSNCHDMDDSELAELGIMSVAQCELTPLEILVLRLLRQFCLTHARPEGQTWRHAMTDASFHLGAEAGPVLALAASDFLDAVRSERMEPFNFVDPDCPHCSGRIFPAEWSMLAILRGVRHPDPLLVDAMLTTLLHMDWGATRRAARRLAGAMQALEPERHEISPVAMSSAVH